jgi:hypothetical protein
MYTGLIFKEGLSDFRIINDKEIKISRIEEWDIDDGAADFQPKKWTAIHIEGNEKNIEKVAKKISVALLPQWYAKLSDKFTEFIIYHNNIFKFKKTRPKDIREAIAYGISIGIPEHQFDWL